MFGRIVRNITKYDKDNNLLDYSDYTLSGKQLNHYSANYNASGKITDYVWYKPGTEKVLYRNTYVYNSDGYMTQALFYEKSQEPVSTLKYVYTSSIASHGK